MADKKEEKQEAPAFDIKSIISEAIAQALPAAVQIAMQTTAKAEEASDAAEAKAKAAAATAFLEGGRCQECEQPIVRGKYACNKEHRMAVVFPDINEAYFQGIMINGKCYRSDYDGHAILVPKDANVEHMVAAYNQSERNLAQGKHRNARQSLSDFRHRKSGG